MPNNKLPPRRPLPPPFLPLLLIGAIVSGCASLTPPAETASVTGQSRSAACRSWTPASWVPEDTADTIDTNRRLNARRIAFCAGVLK